MRKKENADKILSKAKRLFSKLGKKTIPESIQEVIKPFNYEKSKLLEFEVSYTLELINEEFQAWLSKQSFSGGEKAYKYIDEKGEVYRGVSMAWPNKEEANKDYFIPLIHPITKNPCPIPRRGWRNPPATMKLLLDKGLILFGEDEAKQPERKYLLKENLLENTTSIFNYAGSDDDLLSKLDINFPYAKPVGVGKYLITSIHPEPKIVLDFFAGSGTAGQAVIELNKEGKDIQFILITNNEDNIMTDACLPRIKRTISGYKDVQGLGGSLKYYKTAFVGKHNILDADDKDKIQLAHHAGGMLAIAEDTLDQVDKTDYWQIFENKDRMTAVYFREEQDQFDEFVEKVVSFKKPVTVYMFSWEEKAEMVDFESRADIGIKTIPQPVLEIYKQIYNLI